MNAVERLQLAQVADHCVRWLRSQGIKVKSVVAGATTPLIHVKYNPRVDLFDDITHAYERSQYGERRKAWVFRHGCQIKWTVPSQNPHNTGGAA